jgi:ribosomal protein L11 methylase PrmA
VLETSHPETYDVVIANISTAANMGLAEIFGHVVKPGGTLLLSGILAVDEQRVTGVILPAGFTATAQRYDGDWCLLEYVRL